MLKKKLKKLSNINFFFLEDISKFPVKKYNSQIQQKKLVPNESIDN